MAPLPALPGGHRPLGGFRRRIRRGSQHYLREDEGLFSDADESLADADEGLADQSLPDVEVPELSESDQAQGFSDLELIQRTRRLLEWIDMGKEVTQTGMLRLKDLPAAAARVGIRVRAAGKGAPPADPLPGLEESIDDSVPAVRTMHHVPLLSTIWLVLQEAVLISVSTTAVRLTSRAEQWLEGGSAEQVDVDREFVIAFLRQAVLEQTTTLIPRLQEATSALVMAVLIAGTTQRAAPREWLEIDAEASDSADFTLQLTPCLPNGSSTNSPCLDCCRPVRATQ